MLSSGRKVCSLRRFSLKHCLSDTTDLIDKFHRQMIAQKTGGSIVLIASTSAHRVNFPQPQVHYNASKAAVVSIKSSLAAEWARYGIRVNSISPGYMDTILNEGPGLEKSRQIWASRNPMGRMGQPEELIGPIVMLCSRAGSYVNGCDIVVDGKKIHCIYKKATN
jgi:NAD(P)-dependent dehydrogenase (short-subunit alcohol dehydrogenase family)